MFQSFPSTTLATIIDVVVSPTTLSIVAGGSIIVAIIVKIGSAATGYPIIVIISISEIVPPPIGTAVTSKFASSATPNIESTLPTVPTSVPNKHTKNIILNTDPMIEPSLWKLVPSGIVVSAISSGTPIFLADLTFTGIDAALEHVAKAVNKYNKTTTTSYLQNSNNTNTTNNYTTNNYNAMLPFGSVYSVPAT